MEQERAAAKFVVIEHKGDKHPQLVIEDKEGQAEVVVFNDVLEKSRQLIQEDSVVLLEGKVSNRNRGEGKLIVKSVSSVDEERFPASKEIHFTLDLESMVEATLNDLKRILADHEGDSKVFFHIRENGRRAYVIRSKSRGVKLDYDLVGDLTASIGADNIKLVPHMKSA